MIIGALALSALLASPLDGVARSPEVTSAAILGIEMGMSIAEARAILAPLGTPDSRPTREGGTKEVWRLTRTGFEWIAMKADNSGRLVWLTGHRRRGHELKFADVTGDATVATGDTAIWHTVGRRTPQRLTLRGRHQLAQVVTLAEVQ
jgi:hypothetical protein